MAVAATAVLFRIIFVLVTSFQPITNENNYPASIHHISPSSDYGHYKAQSVLYFQFGFMEVIRLISKYHYGSDYEVPREVKDIIAPDHLEMSPPIYPALIWILDYRPGHTLPMAFLYIALSMGIAVAWLKWLQNNGMPILWLLAFALLPHPYWFMINCGSDLLFYGIFTLFFLCYFSKLDNNIRIPLSILAIALAILTRPTGVSLLLFIIIGPLFFQILRNKAQRKKILLGLIIVSLPIFWFFWPYLESVLRGAYRWPFFGIAQPDFIDGIYDDLPIALNMALSWLSLFGAKTLYIFGLRPTYGDVSWIVFLARLAPGIPFLAGFLYLMWRGPKLEKILVLSMLLPLYIGPGQDRYLLPLQPILFFYAWRLFEHLTSFRGRGNEPADRPI